MFAGFREWDGPVAMGGQFNRTFVVGVAGATIVSLGLFVLSRAAARSEMTGAPNSTRSRTAFLANNLLHGLSRSDIELIAFNLPPIQVDNRE